MAIVFQNNLRSSQCTLILAGIIAGATALVVVIASNSLLPLLLALVLVATMVKAEWIILTLCLSVCSAFIITTEEFWVTIRGVNVSVSDVMYAVLLLQLLIYVISKPGALLTRIKSNKTLFLLLSYFLLLVLIGVFSSSKRAVGDARYFFPIILAFSIYTAISLEWLRRYLLLISAIVLVLSFIGLFVNTPAGGAQVEREQFRYLSASAVLAIAILALFILAFLQRQTTQRSSTFLCTLLLVLMSIVIVTQHRSVWIGLGGGLLFYALSTGRFGRKMLWLAISIFTIVAVGIAYSPALRTSLSDSLLFLSDFADDSTARWRLLYWTDALRQISQNWLWGGGFGPYYEAMDFGGGVSPHDLYIHLALKMGLVGLALQLGVFIKAFRNLRELRMIPTDPNHWMYSALEASLFAVMLYSFFYSYELVTGILLGFTFLLYHERTTSKARWRAVVAE